MADDIQQEEEWLYGTSSDNLEEGAVKIEASETQQQDEDHVMSSSIDEKESEDVGEDNMGGQEGESGENNTDGTSALPNDEDGTKEGEVGEGDNEGEEEEEEEEDDDEEEDSDDDDDGVNVVIGDIKSAPAPATTSFTSSKRPAGPPPDKKGKFSVEDFEGPGTINGVTAQDFSLDSIEEKPWRKPGADITDYFNYGFTEETWRAYCDRQKRLRYESGSAVPPPVGERGERKHPIATSIPTVGSEKYGGQPHIIFPKKFGSHDRGQKEVQRITRVREEPRENTIQVMTADRREYSRKAAFDMPPPIAPPFDMSVPPPFPPPSFPPPEYRGGSGDFPPFNMSNPPPSQYYREEYEDQQQWMDSAWDNSSPRSTTVVPLTKASNLPPPPGSQGSPKEEL